MFGFLEFLDERENPLAVAQRAAKMYGKKEKYGKWMTAEKGEHIPLKNFRAKESDSVETRYHHKFYDRKAGKMKPPTSNNKEHDIKSLTPTQPFVRTGTEDTLKAKIAEKNPNHIATASYRGKTYVMDGHHAVMAAALRGEKKIIAHRHYELD